MQLSVVCDIFLFGMVIYGNRRHSASMCVLYLGKARGSVSLLWDVNCANLTTAAPANVLATHGKSEE